MFRILRGLDSRALSCGCLVGVYETYSSQTVAIIDAKGTSCSNRAHRIDAPVDVPNTGTTVDNQPPSTIPTSSR
jgi:hypothetical protein